MKNIKPATPGYSSQTVFTGSVAAAVLALALVVTPARAGDEKLSPELKSMYAGPDVDVIVQYKQVPAEAQHQRAAALGGRLHAEMAHVKAAHYTVPQSQLKTLSNDPDVAYISPNRPLKGTLNITAPTVHSDVANSQGYTGTGIGVAVIDSGMSDMPEFHNGQSRIVYQQSFVPNLQNLNMNCPNNAQARAWYATSLNLQGGLAPYAVAVSSGSLPAGLTLNGSTGNITGIPTTASQNLTFSLTVTDSEGNSTTQSCNMNVQQAQNGNIQQLQLQCPGGNPEAAAWYDSVPNTKGGVPPYKFSITSGSLPEGLSLDPASGAVTGIASTASNNISFTLKIADTAGNSASQNCNMNVGQAQQINYAGTVDQFGHGSHVAGIIGSNGSGSVYIGIAPSVNIVSLRALDQNGNGSDASVIGAIDAAITLAHTYNIRVINLSLGRGVFEPAAQDPLCQAVEAAWRAGIVVVVAAGNDGRDNSAGTQGYGTITAPGNDPYVITVGAMKTEGTTTRSDDLIASYSSKGPTAFDYYVKPDIVAPGNLTVSTMQAGQTLNQDYPQNRVTGDFFVMSGTSMATPVVSGAAALLLQKYPTLTPDQVKARLMKNATKTFPVSSIAVDPTTGIAYTSYYDMFTIGAGYLDIEAALSDTTIASGSAKSPSVSLNASGNIVLQGVTGSTVIWGTGATFATTVIWGTNIISGTTVIWGTHVIWGTSTVFSAHVIWGTDGVADQSTTDNAQSTPVSIIGEP